MRTRKECDSDKLDYDVKYLVTGQIDGPREEVTVASCKVCGNKSVVR